MIFGPDVSERQLRRLSRKLRAATAALVSGEGDALTVALFAEDVRRARYLCHPEGIGLYGLPYWQGARRWRRTMEDAKQTVRRAEIVLAANAEAPCDCGGCG